jgi:hypothetical protein
MAEKQKPVKVTEDNGNDLKSLALAESRLTVAGLDPATIALILSVVVPMIQECMKEKQTPDSLRAWHNVPRMAIALRGRGLSWMEALHVSRLTHREAKQATDAELQALIDDCCRAPETIG